MAAELNTYNFWPTELLELVSQFEGDCEGVLASTNQTDTPNNKAANLTVDLGGTEDQGTDNSGFFAGVSNPHGPSAQQIGEDTRNVEWFVNTRRPATGKPPKPQALDRPDSPDPDMYPDLFAAESSAAPAQRQVEAEEVGWAKDAKQLDGECKSRQPPIQVVMCSAISRSGYIPGLQWLSKSIRDQHRQQLVPPAWWSFCRRLVPCIVGLQRVLGKGVSSTCRTGGNIPPAGGNIGEDAAQWTLLPSRWAKVRDWKAKRRLLLLLMFTVFITSIVLGINLIAATAAQTRA